MTALAGLALSVSACVPEDTGWVTPPPRNTAAPSEPAPSESAEEDIPWDDLGPKDAADPDSNPASLEIETADPGNTPDTTETTETMEQWPDLPPKQTQNPDGA